MNILHYHMNIRVSSGRLEINKAKQRNPVNSPRNDSIQKLDFTVGVNLCFPLFPSSQPQQNAYKTFHRDRPQHAAFFRQ